MTEGPNEEPSAASSNSDSTESMNGAAPDAADTVESIDNVDTTSWVRAHQAHYDRTAPGELGTALAYAIADAKGVDPLDHDEMPPLYESIDAQALEESFFGPSGADTRRKEAGVVTFIYTGYKIVLRADGWIFVYEPA